MKTCEKYYFSDLGLRYFILGRKVGDYGHILENVVYLGLIRRGYDVYVGKIDEYELILWQLMMVKCIFRFVIR